ncbi:RNA polymerase sigma factor [Streptomyces sp. 8ZJF_21]|uniref:RNA polymerase sigma factor n=1 Tax=Streptomyces sp. 8ZJF_21 TaxID=2903141 RepID=UPI001E40983F|nr:sigma-70 family RNA polymerase sigma factor [Streptomyces sp. 8ZJF_21]MCD9594186.1 sigma-70 family RNA polymerase sigma factor [Streptomyces sp. 8ZJF_21]
MSDTVEEFEGGGPSEGEFEGGGPSEGESEGRADEDFDAFYARTYPWLAARAVMLSGNRQNAEDAVQEAYIEAMRRWPEVRTYASPEAWVTTTMRRKLSRDGRRWWFRWKPVEMTVPVAATASVEETAEALAALRALGTLPPRQRQVVVMHSLEGMSYQAISTELGISVGSVGSNLHKARARLSLLLDVSPDLGRSTERLLTRTPEDPLTLALHGAARWLSYGFRGEQRTRDGGADGGRDGDGGRVRGGGADGGRDGGGGRVRGGGADGGRDGDGGPARGGAPDGACDGAGDRASDSVPDGARDGSGRGRARDGSGRGRARDGSGRGRARDGFRGRR